MEKVFVLIWTEGADDGSVPMVRGVNVFAEQAAAQKYMTDAAFSWIEDGEAEPEIVVSNHTAYVRFANNATFCWEIEEKEVL